MEKAIDETKKSKARSLEIRVSEKEEQLKKTLEKAERYKQQLKRLEAQKNEKERKDRTHKLIVCGAQISALYDGKVLDEDEVYVLVNFLRRQKERGIFGMADIEKDVQEKLAADKKKEEMEKQWCLDDMFNF